MIFIFPVARRTMMKGINKKTASFFILLLFAIAIQFYTLFKWIGRHEARDADPVVALSAILDVPLRHMASDDQFYEEEATIVVTYSPHTNGIIEPCKCDLVSIDCLDSIRCMSQDTRTKQYFAALGVMTREWIKENATLHDEKVYPFPTEPIGKGVQYSAIEAWKNWIKFNELPQKSDDIKMLFVNETLYPFCKEHNLKGKRCFFGDSSAKEDLDDFEREALGKISQIIYNTKKTDIKNDVIKFRNQIRKRNKKKGRNRNKKKGRAPALGYLLSFAHIARIDFNRQPPIRDAYKNHVERVVTTAPPMDREIRVSLHIRRADSCGGSENGYEKKASELDSIAQTGDKRMCYETGVYMDALLKIQELAEGKPRLDIYLATDHAGSIMEEIQTFYPKAYKDWNWNFLNYSRDIFNYTGDIESNQNKNHDIQGETAMADLWHLSHGEVFVGHLGSRFGKVSWLLSMARRNAFVPFFTVDGHSFCCEIDEACGKMKPYISSMENCLTFHHDSIDLTDKERKIYSDSYWEVGSELRKSVVKASTTNAF